MLNQPLYAVVTLDNRFSRILCCQTSSPRLAILAARAAVRDDDPRRLFSVSVTESLDGALVDRFAVPLIRFRIDRVTADGDKSNASRWEEKFDGDFEKYEPLRKLLDGDFCPPEKMLRVIFEIEGEFFAVCDDVATIEEAVLIASYADVHPCRIIDYHGDSLDFKTSKPLPRDPEPERAEMPGSLQGHCSS